MKFKILLGLIVLAFIISGCFLSQNEKQTVKLNYSKDLTIKPEAFWPDNEFKKLFLRYWSLRFAKKTEELFKLEAPYFQTMANFDRYRGFVESVQDQLAEIEIRDRIYVTDRLVRIQCVIRLQGKNALKTVPILDQWVYTGGNWYHVWRDPLLFPNES